MSKIKVTIWNEGRHEKSNPEVAAVYPNGIHMALKENLSKLNPDFEIRAVTLDDPDQGLPDSLLADTDVLIWWGHMAHAEVDDALAEKITARVRDEGMGFIGLHSAHFSKPFTRIVGTSGQLSWNDVIQEIVWNIMPSHPIAAGIPEYFEIYDEMYGEPFRVPQPDELVFASWFSSGNILRSGLCYHRGIGKVFYFQPGHESCPVYYNENVLKIISNAIVWAKPNEFNFPTPTTCPNRKHPVDELKELNK